MSTHLEKAIEKSIEGGYITDYPNMNCDVWEEHHVLLDPLFWQCLGKALGYKEYYTKYDREGEQYIKKWLAVWHQFIDWIADGKDPEDFFKQLLT